MLRILKIGMDVHSTNYTLCAIELKFGSDNNVIAQTQVTPDPRNIEIFINRLKKKLGDDCDILCGYEAGCLGFSLYHELKKRNIPCVILAPSTMATPQGNRIKTDPRDAKMIADCLASGGYHAVYVPTEKDEDTRYYIRMMDDHKSDLKKIKQRINSFCLSHGKTYDQGKTKWTAVHLKWLQNLELRPLLREVLNEYLLTYNSLCEKIERMTQKIEELASDERYAEKVKKLSCFGGIKTYTALSCIVETGDFHRFRKGSQFAAYLGLVPGEHSSGSHGHKLGITKTGNIHLRTLLVEAAGSICRGKVGYKSAALKKRQNGNLPEVIQYADMGNNRLRRKYYKMIYSGKNRNVAVTAIARELACFIWGMMTDHIGINRASAYQTVRTDISLSAISQG